MSWAEGGGVSAGCGVLGPCCRRQAGAGAVVAAAKGTSKCIEGGLLVVHVWACWFCMYGHEMPSMCRLFDELVPCARCFAWSETSQMHFAVVLLLAGWTELSLLCCSGYGRMQCGSGGPPQFLSVGQGGASGSTIAGRGLAGSLTADLVNCQGAAPGLHR